jgi:S-layer protein
MIVGGSANDSVNAIIGAGATLTALDSIDGGEGTDTINVLHMSGVQLPIAGLTVKNVENVSLRSAGNATFDSSAWVGVEKLSVTQAEDVDVTAAATTAIAVSGATGDIKTTNGSTVNVASATAAQKVEVAGSKGAVTVTATKGAGDIKVDGGTDVTVASSDAAAGKIEIGQTTASTGAISVTSTGAAYVAGAAAALGEIKVKGGTTVNVTQTATSDATAAAKDAAAAAVTQGAVTVNGGDKTTTVTVKQDAAATAANAVVAVAGVKQVDTVTFADAAKDAVIDVGGLKFTAAKALTAAEVAAAFANLSAGAVHGSAPTSKGIYSGTFGAYSTGAVTTTGSVITVDATAKAATTGNTAITATGPTAANKTAGVTAVEAVAGKMGVVGGKVVADGAALTTVSLDGYGAASTVTSDKLESLSLANSAANLTVTNTKATTLALAVNNLGAASTLNIGAAYTTLNITADGKDSAMVLTAAGVKTLNLAGTKSVDFKTSALTATETVTVTGSAGATFDATGWTALKSVDTTGTTGAVTAKIDASKATYTGGAGVDTVTLAGTSVTKAVNTGAGNDSVQLAAGTTTLTAAVSGGEGTDKLVMAAADAAVASAAATFEAKIDGFEILALNTVSATTSVNLDNLDDINHVITQGGSKDLTLDKMLNNATVELLGANTDALGLTVKLKDATGTSDVVNLVADAASTAHVNIGLVTVAGVETINLSAMSAKFVDTLALKAAAATTVNVTGKGNLDLTLTGSTKVTLVDGSAATGKLVVATAGAVAATVKGGAGDDTLTAKGNGDTLLGGAGADTLKVMGDQVKLTGGAGADTFDVSFVTSNVNSWATITDLSAGDLIKFSGAANDFAASKVALGDTAGFQDYANAAINLTDTGDVSWFQFGGNTYVLENVSNAASFNNASDIIVKITGAVDLSTAAFSSSADTLLIA